MELPIHYQTTLNYSSKLFRVEIIHSSAGTWFQSKLLSHPGKTFFMKHLGDEFLWPVGYDKGIGKGCVLQNASSERLIYIYIHVQFHIVWGIKRSMGKWKLFYFYRTFRHHMWIDQDHINLDVTLKKEFQQPYNRVQVGKKTVLPLLPWLGYALWLTEVFIMQQI